MIWSRNLYQNCSSHLFYHAHSHWLRASERSILKFLNYCQGSYLVFHLPLSFVNPVDSPFPAQCYLINIVLYYQHSIVLTKPISHALAQKASRIANCPISVCKLLTLAFKILPNIAYSQLLVIYIPAQQDPWWFLKFIPMSILETSAESQAEIQSTLHEAGGFYTHILKSISIPWARYKVFWDPVEWSGQKLEF